MQLYSILYCEKSFFKNTPHYNSYIILMQMYELKVRWWSRQSASSLKPTSSADPAGCPPTILPLHQTSWSYLLHSPEKPVVLIFRYNFFEDKQLDLSVHHKPSPVLNSQNDIYDQIVNNKMWLTYCFQQWLGESRLRSLMEGRIVLVKLLCKDTGIYTHIYQHLHNS